MKGKLIIIESGSDASGKATQSLKLYERLLAEGHRIRKIEFPNYASESSSLVKMYLRGDFGKDPGEISPKIASTFYAADRYASYKTDWQSFYEDGGIIISDRYTTSNMVHQAAKLRGTEKDDFLSWLTELEYEIYRIPVPDCVVFLDMPPAYSEELLRGRENKMDGSLTKDIHESNRKHLTDSYYNAMELAVQLGWIQIPCANEKGIRTIDEIHEEVYAAAVKAIMLP